ncbi:MAG: class II aldolase/adducin family protein [Candidatus Micrarchaeia archaeon]|jgi:rhamnose utilization protein RhaD (predicted bifunctional aldolase and dehydrogenase)
MAARRLSKFFSICSALSSHALAQGFGGNISAKLDGHVMAIKASGVRLSDVKQGKGYSLLSYPRLARLYWQAPCGSERSALGAIAGSVLPGGAARPSMEAGFHAFLGKYVAHLHPACFNAIACQKGARKTLSEIYGGQRFLWVRYARPGHKLACAVRRAVGGQKECVVFLQNHGIITSSGSAGQCIRKAREIERKANAYLKANSGMPPFTIAPLRKTRGGWLNASPAAKAFASSRANAWRFVFPDAAVFFSQSFARGSKIRAVAGKGVEYLLPEKDARAANEIFCAHAFISDAAHRMGSPAWLAKSEILALCGMESERHRRRAAGV